MTGKRVLLDEAWVFLLRLFDGMSVMDSFEPISRALRLCTDDDLTPAHMALIHSFHYSADLKHPVLLATLYGNLPCVKVWMEKGACPRLALPLAVKLHHHEVAACLKLHESAS